MGYCYEVWMVSVVVVCVVTVMCVCAVIWVLHSSGKSGGELVTLFDSHCNDGVSAGI